MTVKELYDRLAVIVNTHGDRHIEVIGQDEKGDRVRLRPYGEFRTDLDNQGRLVVVMR